MRVCGTCHFGRNMATDRGLLPTPGAALVLAFSSTHLHRPAGIIAQIENLSEQKPLSMAAAYCCVCRRCTWLCRPDTEINEACLEFLHMWRTAEQVGAALSLMHR
jgi:hypothetical protein